MIKAKDIEKIAVIGAGVIGNSWTTNFIWKDYPVNLWCYTDEEKRTANLIIQEHLESLVLNGVLEKEMIPKMMSLINYTTSLEEAVKDVEFIQEAILEDLELKQKLLADIDKCANPEAIFASSTSSLLISNIAKNSQYSKRCISAHPFNPPHLIPLVEITKPEGEKGSKQTTEIAAQFYESIGKEPIILNKDVSGFIGNQIQNAVSERCRELLQNGVCTIEDIDKAVSFGPGLRWAVMGPYLIFQLGGGAGGIKGLMMHIGAAALEKGDEKMLKEFELGADLIQAAVNKEMANRSPEFGNDNESLRKFRDYMLIEMLKIHKKI